VAAVPWARHDAGHTLPFDDQVAWLAVHTSRSVVASLMRTAWRTVGAICKRVAEDARRRVNRLATPCRIGIDEISYKRNHHYLTVVVDHDTRLLVWAAPGRDKETVGRFFDLLGEEGCARITHVSADGARWIADVVDARCRNAVRGADPFHVVSWATDALDKVRREVWNTARGGKGKATPQSKTLKNARWALWRNEDDLTEGNGPSWNGSSAPVPGCTRRGIGRPSLGVPPGPARVPAAGSDRTGPVAVLGTPLSHPRVHRAGPQGRPAPRCHRNQHRT
jgi:transposase